MRRDLAGSLPQHRAWSYLRTRQHLKEIMADSLKPTPIHDDLPKRFADCDTLGQALDYAAKGERGFNFHDARGNLIRPYPFA